MNHLRWGKVRERLAARLQNEHQIVVDFLEAAQGRERSDWRQDIFRWTAHGTRILTDGTKVRCVIDSYDTMTDCARYGVRLVGDTFNGLESKWLLSAYCAAQPGAKLKIK